MSRKSRSSPSGSSGSGTGGSCPTSPCPTGGGRGANERIAAQIASIGSNLLLILPGSTTSGGLRSGFGGVPTLTMADAKAIGKELSAGRYQSPSIRPTAPVVYGNQNWSTIIQGVAP